MANKFAYTNKKQVKISKPKPPKFAYTSAKQVKIYKPKPARHESLTEIARLAMFESQIDKLSVVNPQTKKRIKVKSALGYEKTHPAYKAALALIKKKKLALPVSPLSVKKGEQIPLFNLEPYEDPKRAGISSVGSALSGDGAEEHLMGQAEYLSKLGYEAKEGIDTYCGAGYTWMNSSLRGWDDGGSDSLWESIRERFADELEKMDEDEQNEFIQNEANNVVQENINQLDYAFEGDGAVLEENILVYRGVGDTSIVRDLIDGGAGTIMQDDGFISTSLDEKMGKSFASDYGAVLKIVARKGTRAIYPQADDRGVSHEKELIINRGTKLKVVEVGSEKISHGNEIVKRPVITLITMLEGEDK